MKTAGQIDGKSRSQPVNLPGAWPLMNPLHLSANEGGYKIVIPIVWK